MSRLNPTAGSTGYQPDIKAFCTPHIMSCYPPYLLLVSVHSSIPCINIGVRIELTFFFSNLQSVFLRPAHFSIALSFGSSVVSSAVLM